MGTVCGGNEVVPRREGWTSASKDERGWEQLDGTGGLGAVGQQIVNSVVKVRYDFVLEIDKMLCFRAATAVGETHCLHLLITSKMLPRVPRWHLPVSVSFQLNYSNNCLVEKGKEKIREIWDREKTERKGRSERQARAKNRLKTQINHSWRHKDKEISYFKTPSSYSGAWYLWLEQGWG